MTPGDIPCQRPCRNILCRYCAFGMCMDNAPCEKQMDEEGNLTHKEEELMSEKTHAGLIAEQLANIERLGDGLPAVIAAGALRKLLRHLDEAHMREIDEAERRANYAAMKNVCEALAKVGPLYDAESIGDEAKLREAIEDLFAKGCVSRHDRVAVCPPCIDNEGYSPFNEWCARCSSDVKEKCKAIYNARVALAATEKEGGAK